MKTIAGSQYASKKAFQLDADEKKLSREDLQKIYDTIPNTQIVKRLRNRPYAIDRIWDVSPMTQEKPVEPPVEAPKPVAEPKAPKIIGDSKKAMVLRMLEGAGTTVANIMTATGWQSHTVRGALSTMRSKGVKMASVREGKKTVYRLEA